MKWTTSHVDEIDAIGRSIAQILKPGDTLLLKGSMGAGKTTLAKEIVHHLTRIAIAEITSPTFSYVHEYENVFHFDLYRLNAPDEFTNKGFEDYFTPANICLVEWPERAEQYMPKRSKTLTIELNQSGGDQGGRKYQFHESTLH